MTKVNAIIISLLLSVLLCISLVVNASSPAEPAFKSQLRSCFESNRNTECLSSQSSWSSCGSSVYSSYQLAVSISMNCMRSVCGSQNSLCCNTYCSMYGLSGYDQSVCFNKCFNPNSYTVASTAAATTLMKMRTSMDTSAEYAPPDTQKKDDVTSVYCDIPCNSEFAFYSTTGKTPAILNDKNLKKIMALNSKTNTLALKKKKLISFANSVKSSSSSRSSGRSSSSSSRSSSSIRYVSRSNSGVKSAVSYYNRLVRPVVNDKLVVSRLIKVRSRSIGYILRGITDKKTRNYIRKGYYFIRAAKKNVLPQKYFAVYHSNGKLNVQATAKLGSPALVKQRKTIFPVSFNSLVPSQVTKGDFFKSNVKHNQICNSSATVNVEYYRRSRITCKKIKSWMSGASKISSKNIYQVNKFLFLVYNKCKKVKATCVVPFVEAINTTD